MNTNVAFFTNLFKALVTLATLFASVETIIRLARFAWNLLLELTRRQSQAGRFAGAFSKFAWAGR